MNNILKFLKKSPKAFKITDIIKDDNNKITHIYFENDIVRFLIVAPHEGNKNNYLFRANNKATFDRWSVCNTELSFDNPFAIIDILTEGIENIYRLELKSLIDDYKELKEDFDDLEERSYKHGFHY